MHVDLHCLMQKSMGGYFCWCYLPPNTMHSLCLLQTRVHKQTWEGSTDASMSCIRYGIGLVHISIASVMHQTSRYCCILYIYSLTATPQSYDHWTSVNEGVRWLYNLTTNHKLRGKMLGKKCWLCNYNANCLIALIVMFSLQYYEYRPSLITTFLMATTIHMFPGMHVNKF